MILNIILVTVFVIEFSLALLLAYLRGFLNTGIKLGGTVIALAASFGITLLAGNVFGGPANAVANVISKLLEGYGIETSTLSEILPKIALAIIKPIAFVLIFFFLKLVFDLVIYIVLRKKTKKKLFKGQLPVTLVMGGLIGIICFWVVMVPVTGMMGCFENISSENIVIKASKKLGGEESFDALTKLEINEKETNLRREVAPLTKLAEEVSKENNEQSISDIAKIIESTETGKIIVKDEIQKSVDKWKNGEESRGITVLSGDEKTDEIAVKLLEYVEKSDVKDTDKVLEFLDDFKELGEDADAEKYVELIQKANENEAMEPFSDELLRWYLKCAEEALGVDVSEDIEKVSMEGASESEKKELYQKLMNMAEKVDLFEDKLFGTGEFTEEEFNVLKNALIRLEEDPIVGGCVTKIITEYEKREA